MNFDLNQTELQGPMTKLLWLHSLAELQGSRVGANLPSRSQFLEAERDSSVCTDFWPPHPSLSWSRV